MLDLIREILEGIKFQAARHKLEEAAYDFNHGIITGAAFELAEQSYRRAEARYASQVAQIHQRPHDGMYRFSGH